MLLGSVALLLLASSAARANPPEQVVLGEQVASPIESLDTCCAAPSSNCGSLNVFVPTLRSGLEFTGGWLYLKPGADNLGWATLTTFLPVQNPQWAVQTLTPGFQPGFTVGTRYVIPNSGRDVRFNWEHLRTNDSAFKPVDDLATQWITPFSQTGPSTSESANQVGLFHFKSAQGEVQFDYDMGNIDIGQSVNVGPATQLRFFAGLSWAQLREQLTTTFYNDPNISPVPPVVAPPNPDLSSISLDNTSTFTGLGPRLGLNTDFNLPGGFNFIGQFSGALLAGWTQPAQYTFAGVYQERVDREQISSQRVSQLVYYSDVKLGLGYSRLLPNGSLLSFEGGFKAAIFVNPFATYETSTNVLPLDIGSLSTNSMRHTPSNFTLSGFYISGTLQW